MFDLDALKAVATSIRSLSIDAIEKAKSGHPGMPLGSAELGAALYGEVMKHNPENPNWVNRDRFILSAGHASMLLYSILHLSGYDVTLDDIKTFRQIGSRCPGHPEYGATSGVECTTGPLGQGVSIATGMALAETMLAGMFNTPSHKIIDYYTYSLVGEGCLEEGVSAESASLAGTLELGKLIVFYDRNRVSIDGSTDITFKEDVGMRYEAYGWQVLSGSMYDISGILELVKLAKDEKRKPTLIILDSVIGKYSPLEGSAASHGAALGPENVRLTKKALGLPENETFTVLEEARDYFKSRKEVFARYESDWENEFHVWARECPELKKKWDEFFEPNYEKVIEELENDKTFTSETKMSTRVAGGKVLNIIAKELPSLVGGSADLTGPNKTELKDASGVYSPENRTGRYIEFGIREFAMSAVCSGLSLSRAFRPFCATFLVFADYMKAQIRLNALMHLPVIYIFTHDSIYVGEDGPTHQSIETLSSLRSIPNVEVFRPGDAEETEIIYAEALKVLDKPCCIVLSRQDINGFPKEDSDWKVNIKKGAYIVKRGGDAPLITILATGSEVSLSLEAIKLSRRNDVRLLSVPSLNRFNKLERREREKLIGGAKRTIAVEAGIGNDWKGLVKDEKDIFSIDRFGLSGPAAEVAKVLHFTAEDLAKLL